MKDKNKCGEQRCIGFIDTGSQVNLVYKRSIDKIDSEVKKESGLGNLMAPVNGKFQEEVMI